MVDRRKNLTKLSLTIFFQGSHAPELIKAANDFITLLREGANLGEGETMEVSSLNITEYPNQVGSDDD